MQFQIIGLPYIHLCSHYIFSQMENEFESVIASFVLVQLKNDGFVNSSLCMTVNERNIAQQQGNANKARESALKQYYDCESYRRKKARARWSTYYREISTPPAK